MDNFETVINKDGEKSKASLPSIKDLNKQSKSLAPYIQPTNFGSNEESSKYGEDITPFTDLNEVRGERQSLTEKYKNGAIRALGTATTSFAEGTVGALVGLTEALATGDGTKLYNNEFGQALDSMNESLAEAAPIYYTEEQQNSIFNANFIPDKLFNGAGYMAGAIGSGYAGGKVLGALGKLALANKLTPGMMLAEDATVAGKKIIDAAKATKLVNGTEQAVVGALSAHGESAAEARGARKDTYEKLVKQVQDTTGSEPTQEQLAEINRLADAAGNVDYLTNLVVTGGTNMLQFGKLMTGGYEPTKKQFWQIIRDRAGNYKVPELSTFGKAVQKTIPYTSGLVEETGQEGIQYATQIGTSDYYARKYDKEAWDDLSEVIQSTKDALIGTINSKEGFESMLLGGILGAGGGVLHNENKSKDTNTQAALKVLGEQKLENIVKKVEAASAIKTYENDQQVALANKDIFEYKNLDYDKFKTLVSSRVDTNQFDSFIEELDEQKNLTEEEFKKKFGFPENEKLAKPVPFLIEELKTKANYVKDVKEALDIQYPYNDPSYNMSNRQFNYMKDMLFHTTTTLDNTNKRIATLKNQITGLSTSSSPIEIFDSIRASEEEGYIANYLNQVQKNIEERKAINPASAEVIKLEEYAKDIVALEDRRQTFSKKYNSYADINVVKNDADEAAKAIAAQDKPIPTVEEVDKGEYEHFVDTGEVSYETLESIAKKIRDGKSLTKEEQAYHAAKTSKVEEILKSFVKEPKESKESEKQTIINKQKKYSDSISKAKTLEELDVIHTAILNDSIGYSVMSPELQDAINKRTKELEPKAAESKAKEVTKEELEDKRFTKSDGKYQYVYRINNGKVALVGIKDSKGISISNDSERNAASKVGESFIPELSKHSLSQLKDLVEGREPKTETKEVKVEKKKIESTDETVGINDIFDEKPKSEVKKKEVVKEPQIIPIEPVEEKLPNFDEDVQAGYTLDKTTATLASSKELDNKPSRKRWLNFIDSYKGSGSEFMFQVVTSKDTTGLYDSLLDPLEKQQEQDALKKDKDRVFVQLLLVDKETKQPILQDGKYLSVPPLKNEELSENKVTGDKENTLAISPKHFLNSKGVDNPELGINHPEFKKLWEAEVKRKNEFRVKLESGKISYIPIKEKSTGAIINKDGKGNSIPSISAQEALWNNINHPENNGVSFFIPTTPDRKGSTFLKYETVNKFTNEVKGVSRPFEFLGNMSKKLFLGNLYVIKDGKFYRTDSRKLRPYEVTTVANLIAKVEGDKQPELRKNIISNYVYLTPADYGDKTLHLDTDAKTITFGNTTIPVTEAPNNKEFLEFLSNRHRQADKKLLAKGGEIQVPTVNERGEINSKVTQTYNEFIFGGSNPAFTIKMKPLSEQQHVNSYFVFDSEKAILGEAKVKEDKNAIVSESKSKEPNKLREEDLKKSSKESVFVKLITSKNFSTLEQLLANTSELDSPISIPNGEIINIVARSSNPAFIFNYKDGKFLANYKDGNWNLSKHDSKKDSMFSISSDEEAQINKKYGSIKQFLESLNSEVVSDLESLSKVKLSEEDKNYTIVPIENNISSAEESIRDKYNVSYKLKDFLKEYDTALESTKVTKEESKSKKGKLDAFLNTEEYNGNSLDIVITQSGKDEYLVIEALKNAFQREDNTYPFAAIIQAVKVRSKDEDLTAGEKKRIAFFDEELSKLESKEETTEEVTETLTPTEEKQIVEEVKKVVEEAPKVTKKKKFGDIGGGLEGKKYDRLATTKDYVKEDIKKAEEWYKKQFGDNNFKITKELIDNKAFGQFYAGITYLWENAEEGTMYHEAYHKVEEEYLTEEQVAALHKETEKAVGKKLTVLEGKEHRAEDFRNYMLTGQKAINGQPVRNTFFRRLYNYIRTLLTGKVSVEQVYKKLAGKGYSKSKKVRSSSDKFNRKFAHLSETDTKRWNDSVTGILFDSLFNEGLTPARLVESKDKVAMLKDAYKSVYYVLRDKYDNAEEGSRLEQDLEFILENYPAFVEQHKKTINKLIQISTVEKEDKEDKDEVYNDEELDEDLGEGQTQDVEAFERAVEEFKSSNEINSVSTTSSNTKMLLASLKKKDENYNDVIDSVTGEPVRVDFNEMYKFLLNGLKSLDSMEAMWLKLEELEKVNPSVRSLMDRLTHPSNVADMSRDNMRVWVDFWQDFNKAETIGTQTLIDNETGSIYQVEANRHNLKGRIKDMWLANLRQSEYIDKSGDVLTLDDSVNKIDDDIEFLNAIGIEFDGFSREELEDRFSKNNEGQYFKDITWIRKTVSDTKEDINDLFKLDTSGNLNHLLELASERSRLVVELSYQNAEGKRIYSISLNNYFSKISNALNNSPTWESLIERYPQFNSVSMMGSVWIDKLYPKDKDGNRGARVEGKLFRVSEVAGIKIQGDNDSGTSITKADVDAKFIQEFNDFFITGHVSIPRASDKAKEQAAGIVESKGNNLVVPIQSIEKNGFKNAEVKEVFKNYFLAELERIRQFNVNKLGNDLAIYNKRANDWSIFKSILSDKTNKELNKVIRVEGEKEITLLNSLDEVSSDILDSVFDDVVVFLEKESIGIPNKDGKLESNFDFGSTKSQMEELGLIKGNESKGISSELTSKHSVDDLIRAYTVNHLIQTIEHHKVFLGDKALYKDIFKRVSGASGTKKYCNNDKVVNAWINNNKSVNEHNFEYDVDTNFTSITYDDVMVGVTANNSMINAMEKLHGKELAAEILDPYLDTEQKDGTRVGNMTEADAQGLSNIVFHRHMSIKSATWTELQEKQYKYEMAYMYVRLHERSLEANQVEKYGRDYSKYSLSEESLAKYKEMIKKNPEGILNVQKTQYFGSQVYDGLNAITFHKESLAPLYWRLVEGTNNEDKLIDMLENKISKIIFSSGVKVGAKLNKEGKLSPFYTSEGLPSGITKEDIESGKLSIQTLPFDYLGVQVEIAPKAKEKVIFGTQFRKLFEINLFNNGISQVEGFDVLHKEYLGVINQLVEKEWNKLTKELGVVLKAGELESMNAKALVKILKEEGEGRQLADNLIDSIEVDAEGNLVYSIDSLVNRPKLESLMLSIVSSRVVRQKMSGDALPQLANTGFESKGKRVVGESNELLSYRIDEKTGKTLPMQVKVPLNAQYAKLLKKYGSLEEVNKAIKDPNFDKKLLTMVGYRIPTQGLNSIEFMEIVEFLPDASISIILPSEIVAKSGGDFDIDKLNIFRPNFDTIPKVAMSRVNYINQMLGNPVPLTKEDIRDIVKGDGTSEFELEVKSYNKAYNKVVENSPVELEYVSDSSKEGLQNRVIEIAKEILENPYMFEQLITPNSTRDMDIIVDEVRYAEWLKAGNTGTKDEWKKEQKAKVVSPTQELMFGHILNQFKYFLGGKAAVGIDAINITAHTLFQQSGLKVATKQLMQGDHINGFEDKWVDKLKLNIKANEKDGNILFGSTKNQNDKLISDIQSQIANLHLDAAKDPKYKDINLTQELLSTIHFLIHTGASEDTIIYLMKQPIIMDLLLAEKDSILDNSGKTKGQKTKEFVNAYKKSKGIKKDYTYDNRVFSKLDNEELLGYISGNEVPVNTELQILEDFLRYRDYGNELTSFIQLTNYDTNRFKDLTSVNKRLEDLESLSGEGLFGIEDYQAIIDNTIVGSFNKTKETRNMYSPLFPLTEDSKFREIKKGIIANVRPQGDFREKLSTLINNDFIGYITQRFGKVNGQPLFSYIDSLNKGENSVAKRLREIKNIVGDNYLLNQLQSMINAEKEGVDNVSIYARTLTKSESDTITGAYRELMEYQGEGMEKVQQFAKDLTTSGMLQSGLNNSPITYLGLIPYEQYQDITKQAMEDYKKKDIKDAILEDFEIRFYLKNLGNNQIVPQYKTEMNDYTGEEELKYNLKDKKVLKKYEGKFVNDEWVPTGIKVFYKTDKGFTVLNTNPQFKDIKFRTHGYKLQDFYLQDNAGLFKLDDSIELPSEPIDSEPTTPIIPSGINTYEGNITSLQPNQIFVFGSNPEGRHGAGTAKLAKDKFGAKYGQGRGLQGQSYGLVTKNLKRGSAESISKYYPNGIVYNSEGERSIKPEFIKLNIQELYETALANPNKEFLVAYGVGKNLNGYTTQEMADMFSSLPIPNNVVFNDEFAKYLTPKSVEYNISPEVEEKVKKMLDKGYTTEKLALINYLGLTSDELTSIVDKLTKESNSGLDNVSESTMNDRLENPICPTE